MAVAAPARPRVLPEFDRPVKLLIVVDGTDVSVTLLAGARQIAMAIAASVEVVEVLTVRELASAVALAERMAKFDGYVALGCVVQDDFGLDKTAAADASNALTLLGLQGAAVGMAVLAVENRATAVLLADPAGANKGGEAAAAALRLIALSRKWASDTKGIGFRP